MLRTRRGDGVRYTIDWMNDDQSYWCELARGRLINIPYNLETNNYTLALTERLPGPELARAATDQFDQLWTEGGRHGRSMAVGIHSFISGQTLPTKYVRQYLSLMKTRGETWLTTADGIYEFLTERRAG